MQWPWNLLHKLKFVKKKSNSFTKQSTTYVDFKWNFGSKKINENSM